MSKPSSLMKWATSALGLSRSSTPPSQKLLDGWAVNEHPPAQWWNDRWKLLGDWIDWLDAFESTVHTWTALQTFSAGISVAAATRHVVGGGGEPAYNSGAGWSGIGGGSRFWKQADGTVFVDIAVDNTSATTATPGALFTLPVGFRPAAGVHGVAHWTQNASPGGGSAVVTVATTGDVTLTKGESTNIFGFTYGHVTFHSGD